MTEVQVLACSVQPATKYQGLPTSRAGNKLYCREPATCNLQLATILQPATFK